MYSPGKNKSHTPCCNTRYGIAATNPTKEDSYPPNYTGILQEETAETISCVGYIGKIGMRETDREIVKMMLDED